MSDFYFKYPVYVGNLSTPKQYSDHNFMDMRVKGEPVGKDPQTGNSIYWGEGHHILCMLEDKSEDMPF